MSTWQDTVVQCPRCATELAARIALGVHVTRVPQVRQQILDRTFHALACSGCQAELQIEQPFIYTDFGRNQWLLVATPADRRQWQDWEQRLERDLARAFEHGSPLAHDLGKQLLARVVFGYEELREKLVIWSANLEDAVVECLKVRAISADPVLATPGSALIVDRITRDDEIHALWFARETVPEREVLFPSSWVADSDRDHASLEARFAELFTERFVSFRRFASATL